MIVSSVFIGWTIGCLFGGVITDIFGRRPIFIVFNLFAFIFCVISAFATNLLFFLIFRTLFTICGGVLLAGSYTYLIEIFPMDKRGVSQMLANVSWEIGEILTSFIFLLTMKTIDTGNWRLFIVWISIPLLITFFIAIFFLKESPRYLLFAQKYEQAFEIINYAIKMNTKSEELFLTENEKENIKKWGMLELEKEGNNLGDVRIMFNKKYCKQTIIIFILWFCSNFVYYFAVFLTPIFLKKIFTNKNNAKLLETCAVLPEFLIILTYLFLIEKVFFGRRRVIIGGFIISFICGVILYFLNNISFIIVLEIIRGFSVLSFDAMYPYTNEHYPTNIRSTAQSLSSMMARIGGAIMPFLSIPLFKYGYEAPIHLIVFFSLIGTIASLFSPRDLTGEEMD